MCRVVSVVIYFSVPLGLFNFLTHWVYETVDLKWREYEYHASWDGSVDHEKPIKFAIYDYTQQKYNQIYLKNITGQLITTDPYSKYTGLTLGWYYAIFILGVFLHLLFVTKLDNNGRKDRLIYIPASKKNWITNITNACSSLLVPEISNDWDARLNVDERDGAKSIIQVILAFHFLMLLYISKR